MADECDRRRGPGICRFGTAFGIAFHRVNRVDRAQTQAAQPFGVFPSGVARAGARVEKG